MQLVFVHLHDRIVYGDFAFIVQLKIRARRYDTRRTWHEDVLDVITAIVHKNNDVWMILTHLLLVLQNLLPSGIARASKVYDLKMLGTFGSRCLTVEASL